MKIVADGVAVLIDDYESQFRASWIVRLQGAKVLMELCYNDRAYERELETAVIENGIYDAYADFMLAQVIESDGAHVRASAL